MSIDFLTVAGAGPPARSPLADRSHQGAELEERDGWQVVVSYGDAEGESHACREAVGWADLSHLPKLEAAFAAANCSPACVATLAAGWWTCPLRPDLQLIVASSLPAGDAPAPPPQPPGARLTDLTCSLAAIAIAGPLARETFARFCALDLREGATPVAGFRPGSVARTPGYVLREAPDRYLLLFGAAYGAYMWEVVADAVERLGGRPVGIDALPAPAIAAGEEETARA